MDEWVSRGKETCPENTVKRIRAILEKLDFGSVRETLSAQFDMLYSAQIELECYSANGKGASEALALASGYAELMERLQNKRLNTTLPYFDEYYRERAKQSRMSESVVGLSVHTDSLLEKLITSAAELGETRAAAEKCTLVLLEEQFPERFVLQPFYSLKTGATEYLPLDFLQLFTGTNGMAAGNTQDEAIVQGACEILERYAALEILSRRLTPPEIPRQIWCAEGKLAAAVAAIEHDPKFKVSVYDASLNKKIPCVMCVIFNAETQSFGVKFGAYPDMKVALERCLTEAFQGQNLERFSRSGRASDNKHNRASWSNLHNILKVSYGSYPASLFEKEASWPFEAWDIPCGMDNAARVRYLENLIETLGSELLVLDNSFLGFPTVYLYAPGLSEITPVDLLWLQEAALHKKVQRMFTRLTALTRAELGQLKLFALLKKRSYLENTLPQISKNLNVYYMRDVRDEMSFLAALCAYAMDDLSDAVSILSRMPHTAYTRAVLAYLQSGQSEPTEKDEHTVQSALDLQVIADFADKSSVLGKVIHHCPYNCDVCDVDCAQRKVSQSYRALLRLEKAR